MASALQWPWCAFSRLPSERWATILRTRVGTVRIIRRPNTRTSMDTRVPFAVLENAFEELPISGFHAHLGHVHRSGIVATTFDVAVDGKQPERTYGWIDRMLAESGLN